VYFRIIKNSTFFCFEQTHNLILVWSSSKPQEMWYKWLPHNFTWLSHDLHPWRASATGYSRQWTPYIRDCLDWRPLLRAPLSQLPTGSLPRQPDEALPRDLVKISKVIGATTATKITLCFRANQSLDTAEREKKNFYIQLLTTASCKNIQTPQFGDCLIRFITAIFL